jgi:hypothetical protein
MSRKMGCVPIFLEEVRNGGYILSRRSEVERRLKNMKRDYTLFIIGLIICFGLGLLLGGFFSGGRSEVSWGRAYAVSDIVGTFVKNPQGEEFGAVDDFVIDTNGRVAFAIMSYGEKKIALPYGGLNYDREGKHLAFDATKDKLDTAMAFDKSMLENRESVEGIYKHFGQSPYWTEAASEMMKDILPEQTLP